MSMWDYSMVDCVTIPEQSQIPWVCRIVPSTSWDYPKTRADPVSSWDCPTPTWDHPKARGRSHGYMGSSPVHSGIFPKSGADPMSMWDLPKARADQYRNWIIVDFPGPIASRFPFGMMMPAFSTNLVAYNSIHLHKHVAGTYTHLLPDIYWLFSDPDLTCKTIVCVRCQCKQQSNHVLPLVVYILYLFFSFPLSQFHSDHRGTFIIHSLYSISDLLYIDSTSVSISIWHSIWFCSDWEFHIYSTSNCNTIALQAPVVLEARSVIKQIQTSL